MRAPILLMSLIACGEVEYGVADPDYVYNPPDIAAEVQTDRLIQEPVPEVDVLFVVDNSDSMQEEQDGLTSHFESFMGWFLDAELDFHVGVISTDMDDPDHAGRLRQDAGSAYIDDSYSEDAAVDSFVARASVGTGGARLEKGLEAVYTAIEVLGGSDNAGFYRPDAWLTVVVISDEDDYSTAISVTQFQTWLEELKAEPGLVSFSSVVSMSHDCPTEPGLDYLDVSRIVGGLTASICDTDWEGVLEELGLQAAGLRREFFLSDIPVESSLAVTVIEPEGAETAYVLGEDFDYEPARNSVVFRELIPRALSEVIITYEILSTVPEGAPAGG